MKLRLRAESVTKSEGQEEVFLSVSADQDPNISGVVAVTGNITVKVTNRVESPFAIGKEYVLDTFDANSPTGSVSTLGVSTLGVKQTQPKLR